MKVHREHFCIMLLYPLKQNGGEKHFIDSQLCLKCLKKSYPPFKTHLKYFLFHEPFLPGYPHSNTINRTFLQIFWHFDLFFPLEVKGVGVRITWEIFKSTKANAPNVEFLLYKVSNEDREAGVSKHHRWFLSVITYESLLEPPQSQTLSKVPGIQEIRSSSDLTKFTHTIIKPTKVLKSFQF